MANGSNVLGADDMKAAIDHGAGIVLVLFLILCTKKMGEFGRQNAHSTLNTDCESGV